ncbi:MAG TPA: hypothetical protein VGI45_15695 [Terracidiphilus sp.]
MKKSQWVPALVLFLALAAFALWAHSRIHFDFRVFAVQVATLTGAGSPSPRSAST